MSDRISSLDVGYEAGDLSLYPTALDTREQLYEVKNNAETSLVQSMSYGSKYVVVGDTSKFPSQGIIKVGKELIYYAEKTSNSFKDLKRGFAGSRQSLWSIGTTVSLPVVADVHNAAMDAIINIENNLGTETNPADESLNGILKSLENRFLAPKPIFRASPISGPAPLTVRFQNFSGGAPVRYLWDFGDGQTSVDVAPSHTYVQEGSYTVKLSMITNLGAQGIVTKKDCITVDNSLAEGFYYVTPAVGTTSTIFSFIDQTTGEVASRYWIFDDGETETQLDPDVHTTTHQFSYPGTYNTALIVVFTNQKLRRYVIDPIIVS